MSDTLERLDLERLAVLLENHGSHLQLVRGWTADNAAFFFEAATALRERLRGEARAQQPAQCESCKPDGEFRVFEMGGAHYVGPFETDMLAHRAQEALYTSRAQQDDARGWRPIAEAPRDGWVLGYYAGDYDVVEWDAEENCWRNASCEALYMTHWMPLPAAPREQSGEEKGEK